jgi:tripartite-type tricarboxylate transporter receptor subunit TctC
MKSLLGFGAAIALGSLIATASAAPSSVASFYKGKTIEFDVGYAPGGGYDAYGRLVAQFMGNHIPGDPTIIVQNMPGGGGRVVAGYVFNAAPKDGTVLAMADQSLVLQQAIHDPTILFDCSKFNWIGNPDADNNTVAVWYQTGVKSVEDAKRIEVIIGATGPNASAQIPEVMNAILRTKFKIVTGYPGGNDINLAMEKGEVGGRGSNPWATWKATRPDWLHDKKLIVIAQIGLSKAPDLPDVPLLIDLASNAQDRAVLKLISAPATIGRPIFASPGVPADRIVALRKAFDETMKDPDFLAAARRENMDINPVSGAELQSIMDDLISKTPRPVAERLAAIIGAPVTNK